MSQSKHLLVLVIRLGGRGRERAGAARHRTDPRRLQNQLTGGEETSHLSGGTSSLKLISCHVGLPVRLIGEINLQSQSLDLFSSLYTLVYALCLCWKHPNISPLRSLPEADTHCLPGISIWKATRHREHDMSEADLLPFSPPHTQIFLSVFLQLTE